MAFAAAAFIASATSAASVLAQPPAGDPLLGLTQAQIDAWLAGRVDYQHVFTVPEGLGPIFNKSNCSNCHNSPVGGPGAVDVVRFGKLDAFGQYDPMADQGGSLLQESGIVVDPTPGAPNSGNEIACFETVPAEATIQIFRITNGALAYGLVEAIPDSQILALVASQQSGGVVSGKAHMVTPFESVTKRNPKGTLRVGRFGWKAQVATVLTFSADASLNEMGLTNRFVLEENAPNGDYELLAQCDTVADPEDGPDKNGLHFIDRITSFQRFLAPPPQTPKSGLAGEAVFMKAGCGTCHNPQFITSNNPALESAIRNKVIRPYSDWLVHDMGELGDGIVQGMAGGYEMKTPPLWGIAYRTHLLHDARVQGQPNQFVELMTNVIGWHGAAGSEAQTAYANWTALSDTEKTSLINFLFSLGRREFDTTTSFGYDVNGFIDLFDFYSEGDGFADCFGQKGIDPNDACAIHDVDQDGDVDLADFQVFSTVYTGTQGDCNGNRVNDLADILMGTSEDANMDGLPDECCPEDLDGNSIVNGLDLAILLSSWGPCAGCDADIDGSGVVNGVDLGLLLGGWGFCQ